MRFKSLAEPEKVQKGDEWLSPEGHSSSWRRVWNGTAWVEDLKAAGFPATGLSPSNPDLSNVGTDEDDEDEESEEDEEEQPETDEGKTDEQGMQAAVSDSDGGEQGAGGKPEPEPKQRGKRGKVRKGGKGK
jgi:hypothetical protein